MTADTELLARTMRGRVIEPGDPIYDASRRTFNGTLDRRPRVIVRPLDTDGVATAVRWAVDSGLGVAIRGGGHSVAGHSVPDDACVIDLAYFRGAEVEPRAGTVEALGGSLLMDLDVATSAFDLAVPSGTFFDTGIAGLTLGGGISYIMSSAGYACDALIGAELVTADGQVVHVDAEREPDLLWALRGGGGNFGVVTRFRYQATPVEMFLAGPLTYQGDGLADVIERVIELEADGPDELVLMVIIPPAEGPAGPPMRVSVTWRGDEASGRAAIAPLVGHPALVEDAVRPMSWLQVQARNAPFPFGLRQYWKGHLVESTPAGFADALLGAADGAADHDVILVEFIHGAASRIPAETASFGGRAAVANVTGLGIWQDPAADEANIVWARGVASAVEPYSLSGGGYLNYPEVDQSAARVAASFAPSSFARLRSIKRAVDPDNVFRFNANIPPG
jgi:FAD/FMN-containing dehydrogenase